MSQYCPYYEHWGDQYGGGTDYCHRDALENCIHCGEHGGVTERLLLELNALKLALATEMQLREEAEQSLKELQRLWTASRNREDELIAREREACAQKVEQSSWEKVYAGNQSFGDRLDEIATAIRMRVAKK